MLFATENLAPFAVASIIVVALMFVGLLLLLHPGAASSWFFTYFYGFYVLDRDEGPTDSIKSSFEPRASELGGCRPPVDRGRRLEPRSPAVWPRV